MADNKKYYWLKLKEDFFEEKQVKYLRGLPDGEKLVIAYLKMQLKSLRTEGLLKYDQILPSNEEELAMILDEDVNIIKLLIGALIQVRAIEKLDDGSFYMIAMQELIGKEGQSAERVRNFRERQKQKALQCNSHVTNCNTEKEIEKEIDINSIYGQDELDQAGTGDKETPVTELWKEQFEKFYKKYPKKVKKQNVEKWFKKNKPSSELFNSIMNSLEQFRGSKDWLKDNGQYIPYPCTWLNQRRWEDEGTMLENEKKEYKESTLTEAEHLEKISKEGKRYV